MTNLTLNTHSHYRCVKGLPSQTVTVSHMNLLVLFPPCQICLLMTLTWSLTQFPTLGPHMKVRNNMVHSSGMAMIWV
jgi:hypothetical protein